LRSDCSLSVGMRFFHSGSIWILRVSASYLIMCFSRRNFASSMSLSGLMRIWSAIWLMSCHAPSSSMAKSSSRFTVGQCDVGFTWI
jgi:hypothetical protein